MTDANPTTNRGKRYVTVVCVDCSAAYAKNRYDIPKWQGRCNTCAFAARAGKPRRSAPCVKRDGEGRPYDEVMCKDCSVSIIKRRDSLKTWHGRCNRCAQKLVKNRPEVKARASEFARRQVLRQGGIPNARKFDSSHGGANHWHWKGGVTAEHQRVRNSPEYKEWRMAVLRRDGFTCVMCGYRSKYNRAKEKSDLRADHIKPFSLFPELRLDVSNGRTLCVPCDGMHGWNYHRERKRAS